MLVFRRIFEKSKIYQISGVINNPSENSDGVYVSLAVLEFLQRKYSFFRNSKSHPPRRLCKTMVVWQEKKNVGNCTSLIKPRDSGNMKGNLMDPAFYIIWELYLAEKDHLEIRCCHGWNTVNNSLQWLWITGIYLRNSETRVLLYFLRHPLPLWSQRYSHKVSPSISAGRLLLA